MAHRRRAAGITADGARIHYREGNLMNTDTVPALRPTPWTWRVGIALGIASLGLASYALHEQVGVRGQALAGAFCFFGLIALFSTNLRAVTWRTIGSGFALHLFVPILLLT